MCVCTACVYGDVVPRTHVVPQRSTAGRIAAIGMCTAVTCCTAYTCCTSVLHLYRRSYGILDSVFHNIADTHVAHHLFSYMPHYHAAEATEAIKKVIQVDPQYT